MRRSYPGFVQRGAVLLAVSPAEGDATEAICGMLSAPYVCLGDPSGEGYDAYGIERASMKQMINFHTLFRAIGAFFKGHRQSRAVGDRERLPGAFVIDSGGMIHWAWRGRDAADHARSPELFAALDAVRAG